MKGRKFYGQGLEEVGAGAGVLDVMCRRAECGGWWEG